MKFAMGTICVGIGAILGLVATYVVTYLIGSFIGLAVFYLALPLLVVCVLVGGYLGFRVFSATFGEPLQAQSNASPAGTLAAVDPATAPVGDQAPTPTDSQPATGTVARSPLTHWHVAAGVVGLVLLARVTGLVTPTWLYLPKIEGRVTASADLDLSQVRIRRDSKCWVFHPWDRWDRGRRCYGGTAPTSEEFRVHRDGSFVLPRRFFAHLNFFGHPHYESRVSFSGPEGTSNTLRAYCRRNCSRYRPEVDRIRAIALSGGPIALRFIARHGDQAVELQRLREWYPDADDVQLASSVSITVATDGVHRRNVHRHNLDESRPRLPDTLLFIEDDEVGDLDYEISAQAWVRLAAPFRDSHSDPVFNFDGRNEKNVRARFSSRVPFPRGLDEPLIVEVDLSSYPRKPRAAVPPPARVDTRCDPSRPRKLLPRDFLRRKDSGVAAPAAPPPAIGDGRRSCSATGEPGGS